MPFEIAAVLENDRWREWSRELKLKMSEVQKEILSEVCPTAAEEVMLTALHWWIRRGLVQDWIYTGPEIKFWSVDPDTITVYWDTREIRLDSVLSMIQTCGSLKLPRQEFLNTFQAFRSEVIAALSDRVTELERRTLIDKTEAEGLKNQLNKDDDQTLEVAVTDWPATLATIRTLEPLIGPLF